MDNFIQAFAAGLEEEGQSSSIDESPASRVNVVLRAARRFVDSPSKERDHFENELDAFDQGVADALLTLEQLHEHAGDGEQLLLEVAHEDLDALSAAIEQLGDLLDEPSAQQLDHIRDELLVPTYRLLLAQETLKNLAEVVECPYCDAENSRQASRCGGCGKPLTSPDSRAQDGEFIAVPASISRLLQLCFQVAQSVDENIQEWNSHLNTLKGQFSAAQRKIESTLNNGSAGSEASAELRQMNEGIELMLAGFEEIQSFGQSHNPEILDTGWVRMMNGYKLFKQSGDRLAHSAATA